MSVRPGVKYPKFADQFAKIDFEAAPMPILCLFPIPEAVSLEATTVGLCGLDCVTKTASWSRLASFARVRLRVPLVCQIFNWFEEVEWEGIRLADVLDAFDVETDRDGYYAIYSRDGSFFETLSRDEARDPRVLLAYGLNGGPLPDVHGGPLRLVVPFLQGYKSVKWVRSIRAFRTDPLGIKRLRGQSRSGRLSREWRERLDIAPPAGRAGDPE
jgi:DMSO/TMAO reductase YedYZ molybdopterin-dependent catalytic subunit